MILLNFEGTKIPGDSTVTDHDKWITIDSLQFGCGRAISVVGGGKDRNTGEPSISEVTISRATDASSPDLFMQSLVGKSLGLAKFHWIQTGGQDKKVQVYIQLELTDAIIASYSFGSSGDRPSESLSINFTAISYQFDSFSGDKVTTGTAKKFDLQKIA
jgi:type VI secretion system secreted protein Hcp